MDSLLLHEFHETFGARFQEINGAEIIADYGDPHAEHSSLLETAGVLDLSFRGRICLTGTDRVRFLHGQVTNDIKRLPVGGGCYAALVTAKGRMQSDLNVYALAEELLLDFEPGLVPGIVSRLEQYIVADDVQVIDVSPHYGLLSIQGPESSAVLRQLEFFSELPSNPMQFLKFQDPTLGELYLMNQPRLRSTGFDLFVPAGGMGAVADKLLAAGRSQRGRLCGWSAFETARIEAGIPRFGQDMDESCLPQECGIEERAVSYSKGCYIGQEVLNRLHTLGHVNRELHGLKLANDLETLPKKGDKLFCEGREAGVVTSSARSLRWSANIALGFVRREFSRPDTRLSLREAGSQATARVVQLPFKLD